VGNEGGKAAGLRQLREFAPVPPFVVISGTALDDAQRIVAAATGEGLRPPYAVRSSADVEDGSETAFAGMFETRLRVTAAGLPAALAEVSASLRSDRLRAYLSANGLQERAPSAMHLVVQNMVDARVAGVCLSRLPERDSNVASIEAVFGLGETLVSGLVEPDLYCVDREDGSVTVERIGNQPLRLTLASGEELVPAPMRQVQKLHAEEVAAVADLAFEVERRTSWAGADIEWAFEGDQLWALQARPVTSVEVAA
jgi:phosphoenolpyruvate synthase/pyruvate phosphate dikinase